MFVTEARPKIIQVGHYDHIIVRPVSGLIGAEIDGVDLNDVSPEQMNEIRRAFAEHLVIIFRGQQELARSNHIRFARAFGTIQPIPHIKGRTDHSEIQFVHRDADDKHGVVGEALHSDSTFLETPPTVVVMRAMTLPPYGGDTAFGNLYIAYETLSPGMRKLVDSLNVVHSGQKLFGSRADKSKFAMKDVDTEEADREVVHPLAVTHPVTGRRSIFLNPIFSIRFEGMTEEESRPILEYLMTHAAFIPLTVRVRWEVGTVVVWDNWAASHSAVGDYEGYERTLERVTLAGPRPH